MNEVKTLSNFLIQMEARYPELYAYIFAEEKAKRVPNETGTLNKFMNKCSLSLEYDNTNMTYAYAWKYICDNEDLHDWWML